MSTFLFRLVLFYSFSLRLELIRARVGADSMYAWFLSPSLDSLGRTTRAAVPPCSLPDYSECFDRQTTSSSSFNFLVDSMLFTLLSSALCYSVI